MRQLVTSPAPAGCQEIKDWLHSFHKHAISAVEKSVFLRKGIVRCTEKLAHSFELFVDLNLKACDQAIVRVDKANHGQ